METKIKFTIYKKNGESYGVTETGQIKRNDMDFTPSDSWKVFGITHVQRNEFHSFERLTPELIAGLTLLYKNGNPQYTVRDIDHGTHRTWGNTKYHGIKSIVFH